MPTSKKIATKKVAKKSVVKKAPVKKTSKKTATKKVAKKAPTKKVAKKTPTKNQEKKPLILATNDKSFWVTNGDVLNSLVALRDALDEMEKEVYSYHVSKEHNDFANWVDAVLCDAECATELKQAETPMKAKTVVSRRLKVYSV
jgi:23S rRNA maturation-related 3'-5' exoribonuclease YhaM